MGEQEYFEQRLDDQINWYDKKSVFSQQRYKQLRTAEIVLSLLIPFATPFIPSNHYLVYVVGVSSVALALIAGLLSLHNYRDNWVEYRNTCENLKREKYMYLTKTGPYARENRFAILVERVETIMSCERDIWQEVARYSAGEGDRSASTYSGSTGS
ncbi:MAG: DUF4231 domain-containing protein [Limnochordia bacterium]|jgi:hypothetical protein|nr:DUF4231 domain-containing protein [Bacillota bacterium]